MGKGGGGRCPWHVWGKRDGEMEKGKRGGLERMYWVGDGEESLTRYQIYGCRGSRVGLWGAFGGGRDVEREGFRTETGRRTS